MIGSPDLLAFTGTDGFGEEEDDDEQATLPEELSVPLVPPAHPWTTAAQFHRDFILVAEFSEQVCQPVGMYPVVSDCIFLFTGILTRHGISPESEFRFEFLSFV